MDPRFLAFARTYVRTLFTSFASYVKSGQICASTEVKIKRNVFPLHYSVSPWPPELFYYNYVYCKQYSRPLLNFVYVYLGVVQNFLRFRLDMKVKWLWTPTLAPVPICPLQRAIFHIWKLWPKVNVWSRFDPFPLLTVLFISENVCNYGRPLILFYLFIILELCNSTGVHILLCFDWSQ